MIEAIVLIYFVLNFIILCTVFGYDKMNYIKTDWKEYLLAVFFGISFLPP